MKRARRSLLLRHAFAAGAVVLLLGCEHIEADRRETLKRRDYDGQGRETWMNLNWKSRGYWELVAERGRPMMLLTIPGGGNPPGFIAVYGRHEGSGCIDAFAMAYDDSEAVVRDYFCR